MGKTRSTLRDVETAELRREPYKYDESLVDTYHALPSPCRSRRRLAAVAATCLVLTTAVTTVGRCLPLRMPAVGIGGEWSDWAVATLVGGMMAGGCLLRPLLRIGRSHSVGLALLTMLVAATVLCHARTARAFLVAAAGMGGAYSFLLCLLFDKTATLARRRRSLMPAATMIAALWLGIALAPLALRGTARAVGTTTAAVAASAGPLMIVALVLAALTIVCTLRPHAFAFKAETRLYRRPTARSTT